MIVDVHTHIFPPSIRCARQRYFASEPAFKLLYDSPKALMIGANQLVAAMDEDGVDRSIVFGFPWQSEATCRENNDYVIEAVSRYPDRLLGLCCVDVFSPNAVEEARRCLDAGMAGLGELAFYQSGIEQSALDRLDPLMALCQKRGLPVMIHTNEPVGRPYPGKTPNTMAQIYRMIHRFPENPIILAHWGGGLFFFSLLKKDVSQALTNVYFDTAASPFLYRPEIFPIARDIAGIDKILFGSDYPLLRPARYFKELQASGLSTQDIGRICGQNACRIFPGLQNAGAASPGAGS
jgi:predicted TIM-barrel fold metal-dependent hydrolase